MIEAAGLFKRHGRTVAVDGVTFRARPGRVTALVGPDGAGKSSTMRLILGLDRPDAGHALINGWRYRDLANPLRTVGAHLDPRWVHPGRSARSHLRWLARSNRLGARRVAEVLDQVGLTDVAGRRVGGFSPVRAHRLGIAAALLGDPGVLLFDELATGLDPDAAQSIRRLFRRLAAEGRTVLVSGSQVSEMAPNADDLVLMDRGRVLTECTSEEFVEQAAATTVRVRSPHAERLTTVLRRAGLTVEPATADGTVVDAAVAEPDMIVVRVGYPERVGEIASAYGLVLHELTAQRGSLDAALRRVVRDRSEGPGNKPDRDAGQIVEREHDRRPASAAAAPEAPAVPDSTDTPAAARPTDLIPAGQ